MVSVGRWSFDAVAPSVGLARRTVRELGARSGAAPDVQDAMALCVTEAATNVVVHAYRGRDGRFEVEATRVDDGLCIYVRDDGSGLAPRPDSPGLGLGLPLMFRLAEHFEVRTRAQGGTEIVLHFTIAASSG